MAPSNRESRIADMSPTASTGSNHFIETEFDSCKKIIKESCITMLIALENAALAIDDVQEVDIIDMEDIVRFVRNASAKVDAFPSMMKEVYYDKLTNEGRNRNYISEEYVMYLHHYGEMFSM